MKCSAKILTSPKSINRQECCLRGAKSYIKGKYSELRTPGSCSPPSAFPSQLPTVLYAAEAFTYLAMNPPCRSSRNLTPSPLDPQNTILSGRSSPAPLPLLRRTGKAAAGEGVSTGAALLLFTLHEPVSAKTGEYHPVFHSNRIFLQYFYKVLCICAPSARNSLLFDHEISLLYQIQAKRLWWFFFFF